MMLSHPNKKARTETVLFKLYPYFVRDFISVESGFASPIHQLEGLRDGRSAQLPSSILSLFPSEPSTSHT